MAITQVITPLPAGPNPASDAPDVFSTKAAARVLAEETTVTEINAFGVQANALAVAMNLNSTTDTSASSVLIGTGAKTLTVTAGKSFQPGMWLSIADAALPSTNSMMGQITSYSGTSLVMNITHVLGSGTIASWVISQSSGGMFAALDNVGPDIHAATTKVTPIDADEFGYWDSVSGLLRKLTFANIKIVLTSTFAELAGSATQVFSAAAASAVAHVIRADQAHFGIVSVSATVAANALTVTLQSGVVLAFRSATLTTGMPNTRFIPAEITLTVPDTALLGTVNGVSARLPVLAIDNAGTVELAITNLAGGLNLDETGLISTTAISTTADAANVIYSTTARANVPYRVIGFIDISEATAGTWVTDPTTVQGIGGQVLNAIGSYGYWQTKQDVSASRALATTYYHPTGAPMELAVAVYATNAHELSVTVTLNGIAVVLKANGTSTLAANITTMVPSGASYAVTDGGTTPVILSWIETR